MHYSYQNKDLETRDNIVEPNSSRFILFGWAIMSNALNKFITTIPSSFNPQYNTVLSALLYAIALSDDDVENSIQLAKQQLFVRTATGTNLDVLAHSLGVQRPPTLGLPDVDFQNLIPNLSLKPKQIRKAFYDTADVFWGPLFSRANLTTLNFEPFDLNIGDSLTIAVDGGAPQTVKILAGDVAALGFATAAEVVAILSKLKGITPTVFTDSVSGKNFVNIRTNTPGPVGSVEIIDSILAGPGKLNLPLGKTTILDLSQRVAIYNIRPNELFIEIPAVVPALRRTLKGSHHFHADATLASPVPPANGIWQGSFFYNPTGSDETVTISSQSCQTNQVLTKGSIFTSIAVTNNSSFKNPSGDIFIGYGTNTQEGPIKYRGIPNSNTILIDPSYVFKFDQPIGTTINVITKRVPYVPRTDGTDLAIYLTSPSGARVIVQAILASLAAAGVVVKFQILAPTYKYLIDNPYDTSTAAPSIP